MAEHYSGKDLLVEFAGTDISAYARSIEVTETAPIPDDIDVTHKGDTEKQVIEDIAGAQTCDASFTALDIYDALHAFGTVALNTKDTLVVYPKGQTHTYPELTLQNARFHERSESIPYDGAVVLSGSFHAKNSLTRSTYSSA